VVLIDTRGAARQRVELDRSVPALLLKLGNYPLHHGGVGVVRSLGRCGVDVYAVTEGRFIQRDPVGLRGGTSISTAMPVLIP